MGEQPGRELTRRIVDAYRTHGVPAKVYRGKPYLLREHGWEGPLDALQLQQSHLGEIQSVEKSVRAAVLECHQTEVARQACWAGKAGRDLWFHTNFSPAFLRARGFTNEKTELYWSVARHLYHRGELWDDAFSA